MRPDGLTARGWVRAARATEHYEGFMHWCRIARRKPPTNDVDALNGLRARLARIEARARRETGRGD